MAVCPVVPGMPANRLEPARALAKTSDRSQAMCMVRSTTMSIWSRRMRSATSASEMPTMVRHASAQVRIG